MSARPVWTPMDLGTPWELMLDGELIATAEVMTGLFLARDTIAPEMGIDPDRFEFYVNGQPMPMQGGRS